MVNENEINETHWNPLTQKQEKTFGFTKKEEIVDFAKNIIRKHAPEELRNYEVESRLSLKSKSWASISHRNAEPQYGFSQLKKNKILLTVHKNLLYPEIPLILKKIVMVHELTHLFSQRSHVFYDPEKNSFKMDPNKKLKKGFDSDEKIHEATEGHPQEFADQFHRSLNDVLGIDVKKFPQFKYIAGKTKQEYEEISKRKEFINVWHNNNFVHFSWQRNSWLGFSQKNFNDYIQKKIDFHEEIRKELSDMKVELKNENIENAIKDKILDQKFLMENLKKHQQIKKDFNWDRQNAIDKIENDVKKWEELYHQKRSEREILEAEENKRKEIERQKEEEKIKKWHDELQKKHELWKTNPPDKNDDDYREYEQWKVGYDRDQKTKLIHNQLEQDIKKYMELKNSNQEISKDLKKRIGENLWKFHELTDEIYFHNNLSDLRRDKDLKDTIEEYESINEKEL